MAIGRVNAGGGGSGGTLEVTAPVGVTVTATKSGKSYTRTANAQGKATFKGLASGVWSVTISDGTQTSAAVGVTVTADYAVTMAFFSATINVTYPAGSTCTCTKGGTTLTASGTGGSYTFTVPEAGEWTVSCTDGDKTASKSVTITAQGQIESVSLSYGYYLYNRGWEIGTPALSVFYATKNADHILCKNQITGETGAWRTSYAQFDKMDVTDYSSFKCKFMPISTAVPNSAFFRINAYEGNPIGANFGNRPIKADWIWDVSKVNTEQEISLDISALGANMTLAVGLTPINNTQVKVLEIWLEE